MDVSPRYRGKAGDNTASKSPSCHLPEQKKFFPRCTNETIAREGTKVGTYDSSALLPPQSWEARISYTYLVHTCVEQGVTTTLFSPYPVPR